MQKDFIYSSTEHVKENKGNYKKIGISCVTFVLAKSGCKLCHIEFKALMSSNP